MNLKDRANKLKIDIPAAFFALKRKETPLLARIIAGFTICYALSPIDLIPDFIPVLGYMDDVILLPALIALTVKLIPPGVLEESRRDAAGFWEKDKPQKWYYALPIILIWLIIIFIIVKAIWL